MSDVRRVLIDEGVGERRGVVLLDGRPEHLLIDREGEEAFARLGAVHLGRVTTVSGEGAFVELGIGPSGWLPGRSADPPVHEGQALAVEIAAEARGDKGPRLRRIPGEPAVEGAPGLVTPAPTLDARLRRIAPNATVETGPEAREAADLAQEAALASIHALRGGVTLTLEPTRALIAVDVDVANASPKARREGNLRAIRHTARLLRLKSLGGAVVIDLVGFDGAGGLMRAEAVRAFEPDGAHVRVLAPNAFGLLSIAKPHAARPLADALLAADGRLNARTHAQALARDLEREGRADPGARFIVTCAPETAAMLRPLVEVLGPRFQVREALGRDRLSAEITTQ